MEIKGKIKRISETKQVTDKFKKREVALVTQEQYPQFIEIQFVNDMTGVLENYSGGDNVEISFNLRGREWTNPQGEVKIFNTIQGWKINKQGVNTPPPAPVEAVEEEEDDLPF